MLLNTPYKSSETLNLRENLMKPRELRQNARQRAMNRVAFLAGVVFTAAGLRRRRRPVITTRLRALLKCQPCSFN